jgi:hypothetical protein
VENQNDPCRAADRLIASIPYDQIERSYRRMQKDMDSVCVQHRSLRQERNRRSRIMQARDGTRDRKGDR